MIDLELIAFLLRNNSDLDASVWESGGPITCIAILGTTRSYLFGTANETWGADIYAGCGVDSEEPIGTLQTACPSGELSAVAVTVAIFRAIEADAAASKDFPPMENVYLLAQVQDAQTAFWSKLRELETALGVEIDGTADLAGMSLEDLMEADNRGVYDDSADGGRTRVGNSY